MNSKTPSRPGLVAGIPDADEAGQLTGDTRSRALKAHRTDIGIGSLDNKRRVDQSFFERLLRDGIYRTMHRMLCQMMTGASAPMVACRRL